MSEVEINEKKEERDVLDGGFAVVDRERLIEEETRVVTPWYKHFLNAFISPTKMFEECYGQEPYKGASFGIVGMILFTVIYLLISFTNPVIKQMTMDTLRNAGTAENMLSQTYSTTIITGTIGAIIGAFLGTFVIAIVLQIIKAIAKDKGKFSNLFKMLLVTQMVATFILCIDAILSRVIGVAGSILQITTILGDITQLNIWLQALCSLISLSNIVCVIWMIIGYQAVTHVTMKKSCIVIVIYEVLTYFTQVGFTYLGQMFMQAASKMGGV